MCENLDTCLDDSVKNNLAIAYKSLIKTSKDIFLEDIYSINDVIKKKEYLKELELIKDPIYFEKEVDFIKRKNFWDCNNDCNDQRLPEVEIYRENTNLITQNFNTIVSIYAYPSLENLFDILFASLSIFSKEYTVIDKLIKFLKKMTYKADINTKVNQLTINNDNNIYYLNIVFFKENENINENIKNILKDFIIEILKVNFNNSKKFSVDEKVFIGFIDNQTKEVIKRIFTGFIGNEKISQKYFNFLETIFAALEMKDKNIEYFYYKKSGAVLLDLFETKYLTNEPFKLGFCSLFAIKSKLCSKNKMNIENIKYISAFNCKYKENKKYKCKYYLNNLSKIECEFLNKISSSNMLLNIQKLYNEINLIGKDNINIYNPDYSKFLSYLISIPYLSNKILICDNLKQEE